MRRALAWGFLVAAIGLPYRAEARTVTQLTADARVLALDGASSSRQRFSDAQILEYLNEAQKATLADDHCLRQSQSFQLVTGTTYYSLPANYLEINRLTIGNKYIQQMTPAALDGRSRGWESASGYPTYYFINFSSRGVIGFAPWPAAATDTDTIKVEYDIAANDLALGTDVPFNGVSELLPYNFGLSYFAASMMSAIDGQMVRSTAYMQVFMQNEKMMAAHCVSLSAYMPSATGSQ